MYEEDLSEGRELRSFFSLRCENCLSSITENKKKEEEEEGREEKSAHNTHTQHNTHSSSEKRQADGRRRGSDSKTPCAFYRAVFRFHSSTDS